MLVTQWARTSRTESDTYCKTLGYALQHGSSVICLTGTLSNKHETIVFDTESLKLTQRDPIMVICEGCLVANYTLILWNKNQAMMPISFRKIILENSTVALTNIKVLFKNSSLTNVYITDFIIDDESSAYAHDFQFLETIYEESLIFCTNEFSGQCGITVTDKTVVKLISRGCGFQSVVLNLNAMGIAMSIYKTKFILTKLHVTSSSESYLRITEIMYFEDVTFDDHLTIGSDLMEVRLFAPHPLINMKNSVFRQKHLTIQSKEISHPLHLFHITIHNSRFIGAYTTGKGGSISLSSDFIGSIVSLSNCLFDSNRAIKHGNDILGFGGALFAEGITMQVVISHCKFKNNFASDSGNAVYTSYNVFLIIMNSTFLYDINESHLSLFPMLSVEGTVDLLGGIFSIRNNESHFETNSLGILSISKALKINASIECPKWNNHVYKYTIFSPHDFTADAIAPMTKLMYECQPCPQLFYTPSNSKQPFMYPVDTNSSFVHTHKKKRKTESCLACPYGGVCSGHNVVPRPNHWGYWHQNKLIFIKCPLMYCCSGTGKAPCIRYDYCTGNRTGDLCGACQSGFSVSILTGVCIPDNACGRDSWFWPLASLGTLIYAMWYTFLGNMFEPLFNLLFVKSCQKVNNGSGKMENILIRYSKKFVTSLSGRAYYDKNSHYQMSDFPVSLEKGISQGNSPADKVISIENSSNKGYFGIFNNFVQMAAAMKIHIEYSDTSSNTSAIDSVVEIIGSFLSVNLSKLSTSICPIVGLTTLGKHLYDFVFIFGIYCSWLLVFCSLPFLSHFVQSIPSKSKYTTETLHKTLVKGLVKIMKFTYAKICGLIFMSVICTSIGSKRVWWYDATHVCLQTWQIIIIIFGALYAIPFPVTLLMGMKFLQAKQISATVFIFFCLFPLGTVCYMLVRNRFIPANSVKPKSPESETSKAILSVLQGPYKKDENLATYWEAMVFFRRLLTSAMKLVGLASVRMMILSILWAIFLLQHIYIYPFEVRSSNHVETCSLFLLLIVAMINLLKAFQIDSGLTLNGPTVPFLQALESVEKILLIPLLIIITFIEVSSQKTTRKRFSPAPTSSIK